ncbi:MAG: zinc ribbon domain-containing protein [Planctomycetota bacterium]|nr:zinc ribbon domain-containing protein [Planctomycetota bacterium]
MPIFEFECRGCGKVFEILMRADTKVRCPHCGSAKAAKRFSVFATAHGKEGETPPCRRARPGCDPGKCGSGRCGIED